MKFVPNAITRVVGRQLLLGQKHSPAILFGVGVVGIGTSVVLACRATLKLEEVLDETSMKSAEAKSVRAAGHPDYSEDDLNQDLLYLKVRGVAAICKLYAPAALIGVGSIAALTGSHVILTRRNAALAAAYTALETGFNNYRDRVAAKYGRDAEDELYYDLTPCEMEVDGKKVKGVTAGAKHSSIYARFFDEHSTQYQKTWEYNQFFLKCQESFLNDLLKARGHVFLNEVYDALGLSRSKEGAVVGWLRNGDGDGYIDFGIFREGNLHSGVRFMNGDERSVYLDFNVDGMIYDKI